VTLKSGLVVISVIQTGTIRKLGRGFLSAFHSNYGRIFNRLWHYLASKNGMTFKTGLAVVQDRWKWRRSIDHSHIY